jgi:prepilin-type N-terminal cleavage/methylation domain-containing protein
MRTRELRRLRREAYTLIELLIVITIIAILAGLTLAGVMMALRKPAETQSKVEIGQIDGAIQAFISKYDGAKYVPSRIKVCRNFQTYNMNDPFDAESVRFIAKTIGRNSPQFLDLSTNPPGGKWASTNGIQWTPTMPVGGGEILEGHQCLVFFLGGLQVQNGNQVMCVGFSPDAGNPDVPPTPGQGIGPFYNFQPARLAIPPGKTYFCAYVDPYGVHPENNQVQYYAYFSSYHGNQNDYNHFATNPQLLATSVPTSDCTSLGVWPYASSATTGTSAKPQYVKPNSWQIICAGRDGKFGPGTDMSGTTTTPYYWTPSTAASIPDPGKDDQANFGANKLQFGE